MKGSVPKINAAGMSSLWKKEIERNEGPRAENGGERKEKGEEFEV